MEVSGRDLMGGLAKGLAVVESFAMERPRQSISEVSAATGLDRATARRCLLTLARLGYADYDGKFFTLTPRVLRLGMGCLAAMPLPQIAQPLLDRLSEQLGESSSLSIADGPEIVYVARAAQRRVMSIALMPGSRLPAYCTSMGRVLLAALPPEKAREIVAASRREARTPFTQTDVDAIMDAVERSRADGYAVIDQEVELGLRSIAIPVVNMRGATIAAMNVGVPARHAGPGELVRLYLPAMKAVQAELRVVLR